MKTVLYQLHGYVIRYMMYDVIIDNALNNYMLSITDYIVCFMITHLFIETNNHHSNSFFFLFVNNWCSG